jgi:serine protease AprX
LIDTTGGLGGIPVDLIDLFGPPYDQDGERVHTNSWGPTVAGLAHDQTAREVDEFVWDNPDLVICYASGNAGTDRNGDGVVDRGQVSAYTPSQELHHRRGQRVRPS